MEVHPLEHYKSKFLAENTCFSEIKASTEITTIGKFQSINEDEEELWFLQCPKGIDVQLLEDQKLKLPGRSSLNSIEAVAVESATIEEHAFGYCNRKGRYALRILPVRGSIIIRNKLKAGEAVTIEKIEACCPPKSRVPAPNFIKQRHPLFGVEHDKMTLRKDIQKKLKFADDNSTQVMHEIRMKRKEILKAHKEKFKNEKTREESMLNESKKQKRRSKKNDIHNKSDTDNILTPVKKEKKIKKEANEDEEISPDLKWLQDL